MRNNPLLDAGEEWKLALHLSTRIALERNFALWAQWSDGNGFREAVLIEDVDVMGK